MSLSYSKSLLMTARVAHALVRAIREHGAPNTFAFAELVGAADAMFAGRAVRRHWGAFSLNVTFREPVRVTLSHGGGLYVEPQGAA